MTWGWIILVLAILFLPIPHPCRVSWTRKINAPAQKLWDRVIELGEIEEGDPTIGRDPLLPASVVERRKVSDDPETWENVHQHGAAKDIERKVYLEKDAPRLLKYHLASINDEISPLGKNSYSEFTYRPAGDQTMAKVTICLRSRNLFQSIAAFGQAYKLYAAIQAHYSSRPLAGLLSTTPVIVWLFLAFVAYIGSAAANIYGWVLLLGFILVAGPYALGRWLGYRAAALPFRWYQLLPFIGCTLPQAAPTTSQYAYALPNLGGAVVGAAMCLLWVLVYYLSGAPYLDALGIIQTGEDHILGGVGMFALANVFLIGALNILHLLPILPLDGGHLFKALLQSLTGNRAFWGMLVIAISLTGLFIYWGDVLLIALGAIAIYQVYCLGAGNATITAMNRRQVAVISGSWCLSIAIFSGAVGLGFYAMGMKNCWPYSDQTSGTVQAKRDTPEPGQDGSRKIEPRFSVKNKTLQEQEPNTWVIGSRTAGNRHEWRQWGNADWPEDEFSISINDTSLNGPSRVPISKLIIELTQYAGSPAKLSGAPQFLRTRHSKFQVHQFAFELPDWQKQCIGFQGMLDGNAYYTAGWYCASPWGTATLATLRCLIDSVDIEDSLTITPAGLSDCEYGRHQRDAGLRLSIQ